MENVNPVTIYSNDIINTVTRLRKQKHNKSPVKLFNITNYRTSFIIQSFDGYNQLIVNETAATQLSLIKIIGKYRSNSYDATM